MLDMETAQVIEVLKSKNSSIVLVTGVFDLLHQEHIQFLSKASQFGDALIVGIESDARVRELKGPTRPIQGQRQRLAAVAALPFVTYAFILPEVFSQPEHHRQLLSEMRPAILAVSSHSPHMDRKQHLMSEIGGTVLVVHQHNPDVSTTKIVEQINNASNQLTGYDEQINNSSNQ